VRIEKLVKSENFDVCSWLHIEIKKPWNVIFVLFASFCGHISIEELKIEFALIF
jgi:hypothetical protein